MEQAPSEESLVKKYFEKLKEHECITYAKEGLGLDVNDFPLELVPEGIEFDVENLRDASIRFLNANLVTDTFSSHQERVAWYNESGVLEGGGSKFYLANKLRINVLEGFMRAARTHGEYFLKWHDRGRFNAPTTLPQLTDSLSLENYDQNSVEEKLELVRQAEVIAKTAINEMIEFGWIEGEKIA